MIRYIFHTFHHRIPFLDSLIHILLTLCWKIMFFYFLKFICLISESAEMMIKRLRCTITNAKILKMCYFFKNIMLVSVIIQEEGLSFAFCSVFFLISNTIYFHSFFFSFFFRQYILCVYYNFVVVVVVNF